MDNLDTSELIQSFQDEEDEEDKGMNEKILKIMSYNRIIAKMASELKTLEDERRRALAELETESETPEFEAMIQNLSKLPRESQEINPTDFDKNIQ